MPVDIFLDYLINSTSSMPIHLDENILTELEDSWLWRHMTPHFSQNDDKDDFILNWTRETLAEPDVLGVADAEFDEKLALAIKSETFLANVRAANLHHDPQSVLPNLSFGLEYALRSGKFGDAEGFLDTNILPCLDAARILYNDWIMLKERKSTTIFRESRCLSPDKTSMPLSNITNVRNKAQTSIKSCSRSADSPTLMKKRKRVPRPSGSHFALSLKRNSAAKRTLSIKADAEKNAASQSTGIMDEKEIQRLMKILEETVEHVDDSKVFPSTIEF
ncbi:hypothetical protein F5890DRAFT_586507 [Lentinula detonsa]|uniref:Uncharacterized protein n=1 Tax=Lentinula detonsa TaxID=2804962 RepID=A0AA38PTQ3_9AGAR|nr:hypothetical protein F5890DRAFT_586507 [Lentinula detonsa]